nr:hypothetical protein [Desulfobulbaceae bacterium]
MKQYQYVAYNKSGHDVEFWVCESCRKQNNSLILEGKWRLIDRQDEEGLTCSECHCGEKKEAEQL